MNWRSRSISLDRPTLFLMKNANNNIAQPFALDFEGKLQQQQQQQQHAYI